MLELRFSKLFQVNESPLSFGFDKPDYALQLRFNTAYSVSPSPLTLLFGDGTEVIEPEVPTLSILQPNIGIDTDLEWILPARAESQNAQLWGRYSSNLDFDIRPFVQLGLAWQTQQVERNNTAFYWGENLSLSNSHQALYSARTEQEAQLSKSSWRSAAYKVYSDFDLSWSVAKLGAIQLGQKWSVSAKALSLNTVVHYGLTDKEYICYWRNHPYKGYVLGEFSESAEPHQGRLSIRFNDDGKICYWGLPGGLVRADHDTPSIDPKVALEPQLNSSYVMQPGISCERLADGMQILISSFSYTISRGQFSATANIKFCSRIDAERANGQELKVTVNGYAFYVVCEQPSKSLSFTTKSYSASCRSRFALMAQPYSRTTNYANPTIKTLAGIMSDILNNTGWVVDNQMIDYAIPIGAFSYTELAPAAALLSVAKSVGGILDCDDKNKVVSVIPAWPVPPWSFETATCDFILNESLILDYSSSETIDIENNAVFVRGQQQGVSCKVSRAGTLGDQFAKDVIDTLMTDVQAARQRGIYELANSGKKLHTTIRTKLLDDLPPIKPGKLVGITFETSLFKAVCDTLTVNAAVKEDGGVTVNQTIKVISNV